ncbi:MAG TPA: hypothetical protein G4O03_03605 [Dehalococcoidia bacterium]|jgi:hypothetical protein|nr:hypothetical protein [Dehalococcoidia bacterium]
MFDFENPALAVFKWIGLAFAAGLVGYFGRYLAMLIIERIHRRRAEPPGPVEATRQTVATRVDEAATKLKLQKKRLKLEKKRAKKAGEGK